MSRIQKNLENVSLSREEEAELWSLYEESGNMAEVARKTGFTYYQVRSTLMRDPIRLHETQRSRCEAVAARWEETEKRSSAMSNRLLDVLDGVLKHIKACVDNGIEFTDLVAPGGMARKMSTTEAYQWVLQTRQLGEVAKLGFQAAQVSESMRQIAFSSPDGKKGGAIDPSAMSDAELRQYVLEMQASGREIPWGVQQWARANGVYAPLPAPLPADETEKSGPDR